MSFLLYPYWSGQIDGWMDGWMYGVADKQPKTGHINGLQLPCCFVCLSPDWRLMEYHQSMFVWAIIYRTRSPDNDYASLEFLLDCCRSLLVCPFASPQLPFILRVVDPFPATTNLSFITDCCCFPVDDPPTVQHRDDHRPITRWHMFVICRSTTLQTLLIYDLADSSKTCD